MHHPAADNAHALLLVRIPMGLVGIYFSHRCLCTNRRKGLAQIRFRLQCLHRLHRTASRHHFPFENNCQPQLLMKGGNHLPRLPSCSPNNPLSPAKGSSHLQGRVRCADSQRTNPARPKGHGKRQRGWRTKMCGWECGRGRSGRV